MQFVVDGVPEVLEGVRDTLRRGASQIKIAAGGGTGSEGDPFNAAGASSGRNLSPGGRIAPAALP